MKNKKANLWIDGYSRKRFNIDWEKVFVYGVILGYMAANIYLMLVVASKLTA